VKPRYGLAPLAVTNAEADAGVVPNDVTVTGTPAGGILTPATDTNVAPLAPNPSFAVAKSSTSVPTAAGDTIDYTFTVTNTGNVTISNVVVDDLKCDGPAVLVSETLAQDTNLEYTEQQVWSCTSIAVTQAEADAGLVLNEVRVTGTPAGGTLAPATDDHTLSIEPNPGFTVVKAATTTPGGVDDTINYTFTLVNTGNVSISGVTIDDVKCATVPAVDSETETADTILEVGETQVWSCTSVGVTQAEADAGIVTNSVQVTGTPAGGTLDPVSDTHDLPITAAPAWEIVKATSSTPSIVGDTLDYTFSLVNTGNVTIANVVVSDVKCATPPVLTSESMPASADLDPGETQVWSCTSIGVTQAEVDAGVVSNDVTATGDPAGGTLPAATDSHDVPVLPAPGLAVSKASTSVPAAAGDTIGYTFTVINTGNVTITDVVVTDNKCAGPAVLVSESVNPDTVLEFDETQVWSCTSIEVTQAEVDAGVVLNDVSVSGTPAGGTLSPGTDSHQIPLTANPSWGVVKATASVPTAAGDTLDYTFTLVNTGNVTISGVVGSCECCARSRRDPGLVMHIGRGDAG